jgi:hypothetical protein
MHELKLTVNAAGAIWDALSQHTAKGRAELRKHSKVVKALREGATEKLPTIEAPEDAPEDVKQKIEQQNKKDLFDFKEGVVELEESLLEYLEVLLDERATAGVPGNIAHGYGDAILALEEVKPKK